MEAEMHALPTTSPATESSNPWLTRELVANLIEHRDEALALVLAALREIPAEKPGPSGVPDAEPSSAEDGPQTAWAEIETIDGFEATWPEGREHYGPMRQFECFDGLEKLRLAYGSPAERLTIYGSDRGWVSVWWVVNGKPRQQLANFLEADDFETSGERLALISGKNGSRKAGYMPGEQHLLPPVYKSMRLAVQRDRIAGEGARNRLAVVAGDNEAQAMLDHGLAHLRLRNRLPSERR
jgi:hypothetical protein